MEKKEENVIIIFGDYVVDLFKCDDGDLGITVEKAPMTEDSHCVDIFVDKDNLQVHYL